MYNDKALIIVLNNTNVYFFMFVKHSMSRN